MELYIRKLLSPNIFIIIQNKVYPNISGIKNKIPEYNHLFIEMLLIYILIYIVLDAPVHQTIDKTLKLTDVSINKCHSRSHFKMLAI